MKVLLVGSGYMAIEYAKVLEGLNLKYTVVGRGIESAEKFKAATNKEVITGGIENMNFKQQGEFTHAIVATTLESLEENTLFLLDKGIKKLLVEKPGALTKEGLNKIQQVSNLKEANVFIAYNRRFYASVLNVKERIEADGGLASFLFEFTEWSHVVSNLNKPRFQLENWLIANSTHVIDTAFYIGGSPLDLTGFKQDKIDWHPQGSIFVGSGITQKNALFSYHANWEAPGSWKLEFLTNSNRYIFRPLEQLHVQKLGSVLVEKIEIDDSLDLQYKPGLYKQVEQFLFKKPHSELLTIKKAIEHFQWYEKIINSSEV